MKLLNWISLITIILVDAYKEASIYEKIDECVGDSKDVNRILECAYNIMPRDENDDKSKMNFANLVNELAELNAYKNSKLKKEENENQKKGKKDSLLGNGALDLDKLLSNLENNLVGNIRDRVKQAPGEAAAATTPQDLKNAKNSKLSEFNRADFLKALDVLLESPSIAKRNPSLNKEKLFRVMDDLLKGDSSKLFDQVFQKIDQKLRNRKDDL